MLANVECTSRLGRNNQSTAVHVGVNVAARLRFMDELFLCGRRAIWTLYLARGGQPSLLPIWRSPVSLQPLKARGSSSVCGLSHSRIIGKGLHVCVLRRWSSSMTSRL